MGTKKLYCIVSVTVVTEKCMDMDYENGQTHLNMERDFFFHPVMCFFQN